MTNYKIEYNKYLNWPNSNKIAFLEYLCERLQYCQDKRNHKRVQYYEELIQEEQENAGAIDYTIELRSDN